MKSLPKPLIIGLLVVLLLGLGVGGVYLFRSKIPLLAPKPEEVTLTYWGLFEPQEVIEPLVAEYQRNHPNVTINYQLQSYSTFGRYKETLHTRLKQGGGPDIARVHATWIPQLVNQLVSSPSTVDLQTEFETVFYPVAKDSCQIQGATYCVPLMYDGLILLYNKDLFKEAAISSPPVTWREFREVAVKLTQWVDNDPQGEILQAGAAIGAVSNVTYASDILGLMFSQSEISIPAHLSSQAAEDVLAFYTNFVLKDHVWDDTLPSEVTLFSAGKVGMILVPSWELVRLEQSFLEFDWGVSPVPQVPVLEGDLTDVGWANFWVEAVTSSSSHPEEAWQFLKFLSEKSSQETLFNRASQIRGSAFPYSRRDMEGLLTENLSSVVAHALNSKTGPIAACSGNADYEQVIVSAVSKVLAGGRVGSTLKSVGTELSSLVESRSLGLEAEEVACSLVSFGVGIPEIEEPEEFEEVIPTPASFLNLSPTPSLGLSPTPSPAETEPEQPLSCLSLSVVPPSGDIPLEVTFSARPSNPARVKIYRFAFGDGGLDESIEPIVTHTYSQAGTYVASVRIEDLTGVLTAETSLCQASVSARRPQVTESSPSAKIVTGTSIPNLLITGLGILFLLFGFLL